MFRCVWAFCFGVWGLAVNVHPVPCADVTITAIEPSQATGMAMAVVVDPAPLAHTAQFLPVDGQGRLVGKGQPDVQVAKLGEHLMAALDEARSNLGRVVKINVVVRHTETVAVVQRALAQRFRNGHKPAMSYVVGALAHPDADVALDAVAVVDGDTHTDTVKRLSCVALPKSAGSHVAVLPRGAVVYVSGQAEKGELISATRKTLESLRATLGHLRLKGSGVVQLRAFMQPMTAAAHVEKEIAAFFAGQPVPPVIFVEWVSSLPIEIELIAAAGPALGKDVEPVEYLTPPGIQASPVYSRVARVNHGKTVYISGLYGTTAGDAAAQVREVFGTLGRLLDKTGSDFRHLVKATYYVSDDDASRRLNELRPKYYDPKRPPAASKATVPGVGQPGKSITLDMIAVTAR